MKLEYACGKCGSNGLYRDDDIVEKAVFIACRICGNRWPSGIEPVKVGDDACVAPTLNQMENEEQITEEKMTKRQKDKNGKILVVCADCGRLKRHNGRGLCGKCYPKMKREGTLPPLLKHGRKSAPPAIIPACHPVIPADPGSGSGTGAGIQEAGTIITVPSPNILLVFPPDDRPLYDAILADAKRCRRDPDQQVLWILQNDDLPRE